MAPSLDAISKQIVEQLQLDGRKSYAEIAKVVGLSEAAVRQRVQKLTDARSDADCCGYRPDAAGL